RRGGQRHQADVQLARRFPGDDLQLASLGLTADKLRVGEQPPRQTAAQGAVEQTFGGRVGPHHAPRAIQNDDPLGKCGQGFRLPGGAGLSAGLRPGCSMDTHLHVEPPVNLSNSTPQPAWIEFILRRCRVATAEPVTATHKAPRRLSPRRPTAHGAPGPAARKRVARQVAPGPAATHPDGWLSHLCYSNDSVFPGYATDVPPKTVVRSLYGDRYQRTCCFSPGPLAAGTHPPAAAVRDLALRLRSHRPRAAPQPAATPGRGAERPAAAAHRGADPRRCAVAGRSFG